MEKLAYIRRITALALLLGLLIFALVGCQMAERRRGPTPTASPPTPIPWETIYARKGDKTLPFETIKRTDAHGGDNYPGTAPQLVVVESVSEAMVVQYIASDAQARLQGLDYSQYFAVIVFEGTAHSNTVPLENPVEVKRVGLRDNVVTVYAYFYTPGPSEARQSVLASGYHIIQVQRPKGLAGDVEYVLNINGEDMLSQRESIPYPLPTASPTSTPAPTQTPAT